MSSDSKRSCAHGDCESEICNYTYSYKPSWFRQKFMLTYKTADAVFIVGKDKKEVPAYSAILSLTNVLFREMFAGDEKRIEIPEFQAGDFKLFLEYLYFDEIDFARCNPFEIYKIARKYMIKILCGFSVTEICSRVNNKSIFKIMEWNQTNNEYLIELKVNQFFSENPIVCLTANRGYIGLSKVALVKLLRRADIRCSDEFLFENLLVWAEHELEKENQEKTVENKKKMIADLLPIFQCRIPIKDDLTFNKSYLTSRYFWPIYDKIAYHHGTIEKITHNQSYSVDTMVFGFKLPLHKHNVNDEKFTISVYTNCRTVLFKENFCIKLKNNKTLRVWNDEIQSIRNQFQQN